MARDAFETELNDELVVGTLSDDIRDRGGIVELIG